MGLVARGGGAWLAGTGALAAAATAAAAVWPSWWTIGAGVALWVLLAFFGWFFRDPDRMVAPELCAPADGKVVRIDQVDDPDLGRCDRLCIFMSPLDVHVNRYPAAGAVRAVVHHDGAHIPAFDKDSDRNERVVTHVDAQTPLKVVQIAGAVARRIVSYHEAGHTAENGQRMGMIRLGSRCDIILPEGAATWTVRVGDITKAGTTHIATWRRP